MGKDEAAPGDSHLDEIHFVGLVGKLHDVGKVAIPDSILQKDGPLTDEEWVKMKQHPGIATLTRFFASDWSANFMMSARWLSPIQFYKRMVRLPMRNG